MISWMLGGLGRRQRLLRAEVANRSLRRLLRQRVKRLCDGKEIVKVVIGAASTKCEGWLSTDLPILNALNPGHWRSIFPPGSIDRILAEHVIEHCQC